MSGNSNTSDQFAQIGKALSTTASAFFGSQSMEDTILSYSSPYKKLLHQTITHAGSSNSILKLHRSKNPFKSTTNDSFQDLYSATNGKSFFQNQFSNSKTSFQVLSYLSEELLNDIPSDNNATPKGSKLLTENGEKAKKKKNKNEPSLFQGFTASLPVINETIDTQKKIDNGEEKSLPQYLTNGSDSGSYDEDAEFSLPGNIDSKQINNTYSLSFLHQACQKVTDNLDLLEIQKNLAASEIREIDTKLEKLKIMRDLVFKRVAKVEQNELFLEKHLINIKDRIDMIKEYGLEQEDDSSSEEMEAQKLKQASLAMGRSTSTKSERSNPTEHEENDRSEDDSENETSALISQSIYQKLQNNPPQSQANALNKHINYKKKQQQYSHHHRKTFPTLQQYYDPGSKIASFQKAHDDSITCLDFDMPFGTMCTAGKLDHEVKIWDLSKKTHIGNLAGHLASISCMQMDQYNTLITGGRDALLKLWDVERAVQVYDEGGTITENNEDLCIHNFDAHVDEITALHFESDVLISGSQDRTIRQWDLNTGKCLQTLDLNFTNRGPSGGLSTIRSNNPRSSVLLTRNEPPVIGALQCYDAALATGTKDGVVRLWDLRSGQVVRTLEGHTDAITGLQFDSVNLVTGSMDRSIRIWDLRTGLLAEAFAYESPISCLQFDLDKIAVATNENAVRVYDRKEDRHWVCGGDKPVSEENNNVEFIRYKNGYLIDGRTNGDVNTWAI